MTQRTNREPMQGSKRGSGRRTNRATGGNAAALSRRARRKRIIRRRRIVVSVIAVAVIAAIVAAVIAVGGLLSANSASDESSASADDMTVEQADTQPYDGDLDRDDVPQVDAASVKQQELDALRTDLEQRIAGYQGTWQVYVEDLATGASIEINNHQGYSASVVKLYVMLAVFQRINDGELTETSTIDSLLEQMITVSSNEATNTLIDTLGDGDADAGFAIVNQIAQDYGFTESFINQYLGYTDGDPTRKQTSAHDSGAFMAAVYRGELVTPEYSQRMLDLLLAQTRRTKIPGGVPDGTLVANKTGEITGVENDAAIVFATSDASGAIDGSATEGDYVLTVMTEDITDSSATQTSIRDLSSAVWSALVG